MLQEWQPEKRPVDVTTVISDSVGEVTTKFPEAEFLSHLPEAAWVRLPDEFEMAITELLRNAVEHTDCETPTVRITVHDRTEGGDSMRIGVEDNGPGIPEHEIDVLSSEEETPLAHSEGLRLWMVRWIVNAGDGTIQFDESDLGGSRFRIEFPQAEPPGLTLSM